MLYEGPLFSRKLPFRKVFEALPSHLMKSANFAHNVVDGLSIQEEERDWRVITDYCGDCPVHADANSGGGTAAAIVLGLLKARLPCITPV